MYAVLEMSQSLAIVGPISEFGRPKSTMTGQFYCSFSMGQQSLANLQIVLFSEMANQFLTLLSTSD